MNERRLLETFLDLVKLPCPSGHEAQAAAYCKDALEACGCTATIDDAGEKIGSDTGNVYAVLPGTAPGSLIMTAHLDCVQPCENVKPQIKDGVITSDGTTVLGGDDKVGVASIIEAVRTLVEEGVYPTVKILFTIQEEVGCCGAGAFNGADFEEGEPCFVFDDAGSVGGACTAAPYHYTMRAKFIGKASHAGVAPEKGINAIVAASLAIAKMHEQGVLGAVGPYCASNIGIIEGGSAFNVVAPSCDVTGECRAVEREDVERVHDAMDAALHEAANQMHAQVEVDWDLEYPGYEISEDSPVVQMFCKAARKAGFEPHTFASAGGTDANMLVRFGVAPLVVSTGMTNFHSVDECLKVSDLNGTARLAISLALEAIR